MSDDRRPRAGKKKHRKPEAEADPEFQIAPMIDILLVLLVFFMSISSTEVLQQNQNVELPVAKEAKEAKDNPGQVIVNVLFSEINNITSVEVNDKVLTAEELVPVLATAVQKNPQTRVLMRADKKVRYEFLRTLLESVGKSGVGDVTFSVVDKDQNAKPAKI